MILFGLLILIPLAWSVQAQSISPNDNLYKFDDGFYSSIRLEMIF